MDYEDFFQTRLNALRDEGNYWVFAELERLAGDSPTDRARSFVSTFMFPHSSSLTTKRL